MPDYEYALVTAFTRSPFGGNPALIVFLDSDLSNRPSDEVCKQIAATFNQPVACFVSHPTHTVTGTGSDDTTETIRKNLHAHIRSWSPGFVELPICGHGTLAATFALYQRLGLTTAAVTGNNKTPNVIDFETHQCGTISARRRVQHHPNHDHLQANLDLAKPNLKSEMETRELIEIELPLFTPVSASEAEIVRLSATLMRAVRRPALTNLNAEKKYEDGMTYEREVKVRNVIVAAEAAVNVHARFPYLIEVDESEDIENIEFDTEAFADSAPYTMNIITQRATGARSKLGYDYEYRMFAPRAQIPEDHVCGSANCLLGSYWAEQLGRTELKARAVSRRGGDVWIGVDEENKKLWLRGEATIVSEGKVHVPET